MHSTFSDWLACVCGLILKHRVVTYEKNGCIFVILIDGEYRAANAVIIFPKNALLCICTLSVLAQINSSLKYATKCDVSVSFVPFIQVSPILNMICNIHALSFCV